VHQVLIDEADENIWHLEGEIDLDREFAPGEPLVTLRRIGT
jgi:hypothetical protein